MPPSPLIVIGAGITGLTTATLLQQQLPKDTPITIIAAETPDTEFPTADYASMWAGAHYRPCHPLNTPQLIAEEKLALRTAEAMRRIARENPEAGVAEMPGIEYIEEPPKEILNLRTGDVYAWPGDGFRVLEKDELPPGAEWGCVYQTYGVNIRVYIKWLLSRFLAKGGKLIQKRLSSADEAFKFVEKTGLEKAQIVVNCSGRNFDHDPKMKIIRGQTVLVKNKYHGTATWQKTDGMWEFLIDRPCNGGTIVGGTKEIGDWEAAPRAETRATLLESCVESFPDFVADITEFDVIQDNVGRRPWREGGYRFEAEQVRPGRTVVHGYGAGGRGFELSWGAAGKVVELVLKAMEEKARL